VKTVLKSGSLGLLELSGPVQACTGSALPLPLRTHTQEFWCVRRVVAYGCSNDECCLFGAPIWYIALYGLCAIAGYEVTLILLDCVRKIKIKIEAYKVCPFFLHNFWREHFSFGCLTNCARREIERKVSNAMTDYDENSLSKFMKLRS
jgi:hypothetical protein